VLSDSTALGDAADRADYEAARRAAPYGDDDVVGRDTALLVQAGHSILQIHKLAADERAHVTALLELFAPPHGALVLDAGCGVGEIARLMREMRPDLRFILQNVSKAQLAMCPADFERIECDYHTLPLPDEAVEAVMFTYSLGHGRLGDVLREAARVLKSGGVLFIYDLAAEDSSALISSLGYVAHARDRVVAEGARCELALDFAKVLEQTTTAHLASLIGSTELAALLGDAVPVAYRFTKP
jgi:SAM-dependent methyltransferase